MKIRFLLLNIMLGVCVAASAGEKSVRGPASLTQNFVLGLNSVDVTVSFESVQNLSLVNLGLSALIINPLDPLLLSRLPASVTIPSAFPVLVHIDPLPLPLVGLEFTGVASVILYTTDLHYTPGTRLRLFSAHNGGPFVDITEETSAGSYRVRGSQGEFSEFMIVTDDRDPATIVNTKFSRLSSLMTTHQSAIDPTLFATLSGHYNDAHADWLAQDIDGAKAGIQAFLAAALASGPAEMADVWRSTEDVTDIDGLLRSAAGTLHFSLEDARDTDLDGVYDFSDNCTLVINPTQCDTDGDGYGNHCDADLDDNGTINTFDLTPLRAAMGSTGSNDADLDCNGIVNSFDLAIMRDAFGGGPGPAANLP